MPRPPRILYEGASYHVYSRGNRRERIFRREDDYGRFEDILLEAMRRSGVLLFDWSLMPNHFHFNVETPDGNLSEFMQRVLTRFAKYFNKTYSLVGHLFQGRYGARLVEQESYFMEIVRYVELNPYRLKKGKLADVGAWKWASLRYLLKPEVEWPEGCTNAFRRVLDGFGIDPEASRKNLSRFLADGLKSGTWQDFYKVKDGRFIGSEAFVEKAKQENKENVRHPERLTMPKMAFKDMLLRAQAVSGLSLEVLSGAGQARFLGRWRQAVAYVARRFYRVPNVEIAKALGRDATTISHMVQRIQGREEEINEIELFLKALQSAKEGQIL